MAKYDEIHGLEMHRGSLYYRGNLSNLPRGFTGLVNGMRIDRFIVEDPIEPFENRKIEKTEKEKEKLRKQMLDLMYNVKELPDD